MDLLDKLKQKVPPKTIPLAVFVHEISGISWMIGAWSFMYIVNPTSSLCKRYNKLNEYQIKATNWTNKKMQRMPNIIKNSKRINIPRLATSGIESYLLRNILRPITIPAKLALSIYAAKIYAQNYDHKIL